MGDLENVEKVSLAFESDGKLYAVMLPQKHLIMVLKIAGGLSESGRLPVRELGPDCKFEEF